MSSHAFFYFRKIFVKLLKKDDYIAIYNPQISYNKNNHNYYLYNGENFFTMSPSHHEKSKMNIFMVNNNGALTTALTNSSNKVTQLNVEVAGTFTIETTDTKFITQITYTF